MNLIHRWYCRSHIWRRHVGELLPWVTDGVQLSGARVLEIGSGPGVTTDWLVPRVGHLTAIEYDAKDTARLAARHPTVAVTHGDATHMPFGNETFDVVLSFTMLHHLPSPELQDSLFREAWRVLKPDGAFAGSDSRRSLLFVAAHIGDTMTLVEDQSLPGRLERAGFSTPSTTRRRDVFRFRAFKRAPADRLAVGQADVQSTR